jgi:hypothetical protein
LVVDLLTGSVTSKAPKHLAKYEGEALFRPLNTVMTERYIRAQTLTHTGSHEEQVAPLSGIAKSSKLYHTGEPLVMFSDIPQQDSSLLLPIFPSLSKDIVTEAERCNLEEITLPESVNVVVLDEFSKIQLTMGSLIEPLHSDPNAIVVAFVDAEWNISRHIGVSCFQVQVEHQPDTIFVFRVSSLHFQLHEM